MDINAMFRQLFDSSPDAIAVVNPETGQIIDCNDARVQLWRASNKEVLLSLPLGHLAPALQADGRPSAEVFSDRCKAALRDGTQRFEWHARRCDGSEFVCDVVLQPMRLEQRTMLVAFSRDITQRKQTEVALRDLNQELEVRVAERTSALQVANEKLRKEVAERQRRQKIEHVLYRISEAIHEARDLEALYPLLHQAVGDLMPARNFYLCLLDSQSGLHQFVYHRDEMDAPPPPRRLGAGLTGHVYRTGRSLLVNRSAMTNGVTLDGQIWRVEHGTPSAVWLGAPLVTNGRTLGVMAVQDYMNEEAFGEEEKRILTFIAEQAALAIARKRAEQALRESEERHRALFEATSQGVLIHDEDQIVAINPAAVRMLGYRTVSDVIGKSPSEILAPIQPGGRTAIDLTHQLMTEAANRGSARYDGMGLRADGREFAMELRWTPIASGGRQIIQSVINDITERRRRERITEALYRISEAVHQADDMDHFYPLLHAAIQDLMPARNFYVALSEPAEDIIRFVYWVDEKDPAPPPRRKRQGLTSAVLQLGRSLLIRKADTLLARHEADEIIFENPQITVEVCDATPAAVWLGVPLTIQGRTLGVMAIQDYNDEQAYSEEDLRLLTFVGEQTALAIERKRAQVELRRALEREQELNRLKSNFTSLVSHEFRTPLGIIGSSAEILRDYFNHLDPKERIEHLETIAKHTRRMGVLMEEVLLLSRFDAGRTEFRSEPLNLPGLCHRVTEEVLSATTRRCPIVVQVAPGLPEGSGDERLLRHVLINLLVNAAKYSEPGQPVDLQVRKADGNAVFEIRDRGIGIPEADRAWIFQAFQRGSNVGDRPGTGLGLVIVKRCVDLHRGRIEFESEVGRGTLMRVQMPLFGS